MISFIKCDLQSNKYKTKKLFKYGKVRLLSNKPQIVPILWQS